MLCKYHVVVLCYRRHGVAPGPSQTTAWLKTQHPHPLRAAPALSVLLSDTVWMAGQLSPQPGLPTEPSLALSHIQNLWFSQLLNQRVRILLPTASCATFRIQISPPNRMLFLSGRKCKVWQHVLLRQCPGMPKTMRHLKTSLLWLDPNPHSVHLVYSGTQGSY